MPLPDIQKKLIEQKVGKFCRSRIPEHVRDKVRMNYKIRGNSVIIIEQRQSFFDKSIWVDIPVAQMRFNVEDFNWTLYYPDRNSRWHLYRECEPTMNIDELLEEIDEDPTGIFFG